MVRWLRLRGFRCPVSGCPGRYQAIDWNCPSCQTPMYIAETGYISCRDKTHVSTIIEWKVDCGNHGDHPVYRLKSPDHQGFAFALSHAIELMDEAGAPWVSALVLELNKQYGRR